MTQLFIIGMLLSSAPALAQTQSPMASVADALPPAPANLVQPGMGPGHTASNAWDVVPPVAPYLNLASALKTTAKPGEASPLNPSCAGETGDACVRSAGPPKP